MILRYISVVTLLVAGFSTHAAIQNPFDITDISITEVQAAHAPELLIANDCSKMGNTGPMVDIGWDEIINMGEKVWKIIEAGKPVVHLETPVANALPRGLKCWSDLDGWQAPQTRSLEVVYTNGFGIEVVKFRFRLHYTYGGGKNQRGRYLTNVTVLPSELNVMWGYTFDAHVEVGQAINLGSANDPLAGLEMNVRWNLKTVIKESQNSFHFFVQGDGALKTAR